MSLMNRQVHNRQSSSPARAWEVSVVVRFLCFIALQVVPFPCAGMALAGCVSVTGIGWSGVFLLPELAGHGYEHQDQYCLCDAVYVHIDWTLVDARHSCPFRKDQVTDLEAGLVSSVSGKQGQHHARTKSRVRALSGQQW